MVCSAASGNFDETTANLLLELYQDDGYKDDGSIPAGVMYKVLLMMWNNFSDFI